MIDWASWTDVGIAGVALVLSGAAVRVSLKKEDVAANDKRIDERCRLMFATDIAVIKNDVDTIKKAVKELADRL